MENFHKELEKTILLIVKTLLFLIIYYKPIQASIVCWEYRNIDIRYTHKQ